MEGRPHRDRLLNSLNSVREELLQVAGQIPPDQFDWAPGADMKSFKAQLREIGTMERISTAWLSRKEELDWETAVAWTGEDLESTLGDLASVRNETLAYLKDTGEQQLETPVKTPWDHYFGTTATEPEEMVRWIAMHEYYHLGQIISYRWILGDNPYKQSPAG